MTTRPSRYFLFLALLCFTPALAQRVCGVQGVRCDAYGCCAEGTECVDVTCQYMANYTTPPTHETSTVSSDGCGVYGVLCTAWRCCTKGLVCGGGGYCQYANEAALTGAPLAPTEQPTPAPSGEAPSHGAALRPLVALCLCVTALLVF